MFQFRNIHSIIFIWMTIAGYVVNGCYGVLEAKTCMCPTHGS